MKKPSPERRLLVQIQGEQPITASSSQESPLQRGLRRFWPIYCLLAALATLGYAFWDKYQIDGDAVAYMDIGDLIRAHHWAGVINGYWNPLYPACLALGHTLFHATRYTELHAYYMVNFGIFLLEMLAIVAFTDSLVHLRDIREMADTVQQRAQPLLDRYALRYLGIAMLVIASQRELSLGKVRPDALLQACLLFGMAALLRYFATAHLRYAALMGVALGFAYLAKSFAFAFTILCALTLIAFCLIWLKHRPARTVTAAALAFACFAVVAGPYIAALSHSRGRLDFGDSGTLNYAWYVGGTKKMHLQRDETAFDGSAEVHLKHPEKELLQSPEVLSYKLLPYGTYPDWFDTSFWNEQVKTHFSPRGEIRASSRDLVLVARYLVNHPESWLLLIVLLLAGARFELGWRPGCNAFWMTPVFLGILVFFIYGLVNVEERYVTVAFLAIMLALFASLRASSRRETGTVLVATSLVFLLALLAVGESTRVIAELRRDLNVAGSPGGWYDPDTFEAAHALNAMGVGPGDAIACIGTRACLYDHYWARLTGVRILTEIYLPEAPLYPYWAAMPNRELAIDTVRAQGAKVLVGYFSPGLMTGATPLTAGWRELGESHFYALPLNLPPDASPSQLPPERSGIDDATK
ncbi:hypothetical protein [Edaphobacter acidisoli]|uniref:hypothetical protein n=1 Tax=Edaphobacter acidisoli TaxID=2040573 RepID=UPI0016663EE3|nr:hypothetical protein [Edaphobacter acidisoli]